MKRCAGASLLVLAIGVATACGLVGPPFEAEESTPDLELASVGDLPLDDDAPQLLQSQLDWLREVFGDGGYEPPTWVQVFADDAPPSCDEGVLVGGCHDDGVIQTTWDAAPHLLTHALLEGSDRAPHPALIEGVATWASGAVQSSPLDDRREVGGYVALTRDDLTNGDAQAALGHFVAWIEAKHGTEKLAEVLRGSHAEMTADELQQHIADTLGASFNALLDDYAATSVDYYPGRGPYACGSTSQRVTLGVSWSSGLSPRSLGTLSRFVSDGVVEYWLRQGFEFELPGPFEVQLSTGGVITRCLDQATNEAELPAIAPPLQGDWEARRPLPRPDGIPEDFVDPVVIDLAPGLYDIWLGRHADSGVGTAEGSVRSTDLGG